MEDDGAGAGKQCGGCGDAGPHHLQCSVCHQDVPTKPCPLCPERRYCSKTCQKEDWKRGGHKRTCRGYAALQKERGTNAAAVAVPGDSGSRGTGQEGGEEEVVEVGGGEGKRNEGGGSCLHKGKDTPPSARVLELKAAMTEPGFDINTAVSKRGWPFLHEAVGGREDSECLECLELVLGLPGVDVNRRLPKSLTGCGETTALYAAATLGCFESVRRLLAAPSIDTNKANTDDGMTPLHMAAYQGNDRCLELLLASPSVDANKATTNNGMTPLYIAAMQGNDRCLELLLASPSIDVNKATTDNGTTPLHFAAQQGNDRCLELLLGSPSVDVNKATTDNGTTPLCIAAQQGNDRCLELLLGSPSIDVNKARTDDGSTPLCIAAVQGNDRCLELLLASPSVDANKATTNNGMTPLYIAAMQGNDRCLELLLASPSIDVNQAEPVHGMTPLYIVVQQGNDRCLELLLASPSIDVNKARTDCGLTPLCIAAMQGNDRCLELLLASPSVDVNKATTNHGMTPLYIAAQQGNDRCLELLLASPSIDVNKARTVRGRQAPGGPLLAAAVHVMESLGQLGATDSTRPLVRLLASRRVSSAQLSQAVDLMRSMLPTDCEVTAALTGGRPLPDNKATCRLLFSVLHAQQKGERRWCAYCFRVWPEHDLKRCTKCRQVAYCLQTEEEVKAGKPNACQHAHWRAGHKGECRAWTAERKTCLAGSSSLGAEVGGGATGRKEVKGEGRSGGDGKEDGAGGSVGGGSGGAGKRGGKKKRGKKRR